MIILCWLNNVIFLHSVGMEFEQSQISEPNSSKRKAIGKGVSPIFGYIIGFISIKLQVNVNMLICVLD